MADATAVTVSTSLATATSQYKRDVSERIRRLYPDLTKMLALVKGSSLDSMGKPGYTGKGMIKKTMVTRLDPEWFTYTPIDMLYAATGGSATTANVADTSFFQTGDTLVNTATLEVAVVNTLTSTTVLTVTAVGGTWSCASGQYILLMASTYEEGTARYNTVTKEMTQNQTSLQTFREGLSITDVVKSYPQYTNEGVKERYASDKMAEALRKLENSCWFSKKATSTTTSVTIGGTAYAMRTMDGLVTYAGTAIDMSGTLSWETWNTVLYPQLPKTLQPDSVLYAAMGRSTAAQLNQWATNSYLTMGSNANEMKFGKKVKTYLMGGHLEVEPLVMESFDQGGLSDSILFFQSSDIEYLHFKNYDLKIREKVQLDAAMKEDDIIEGIVGMKSWSNGANIKLVENCFVGA